MKSPMELAKQSSRMNDIWGGDCMTSSKSENLRMRSYAEPPVESFVWGTFLRHNYLVFSQIISLLYKQLLQNVQNVD